MNYAILYLAENKLYFLKSNKDNLIEINLPEKTILMGRIYNIKTFDKYFKKFVHEQKINKLFGCGNIKIIINKTFSKIDKIFLTEYLKELFFNNIDFILESKILNPNKKEVYISIQDSLVQVYEQNNYKIYSGDYSIEDVIKLVNKINKKTYILNFTDTDLEINKDLVYFCNNSVNFIFEKVFKMYS